jgi:hypothetical protein
MGTFLSTYLPTLVQIEKVEVAGPEVCFAIIDIGSSFGVPLEYLGQHFLSNSQLCVGHSKECCTDWDILITSNFIGSKTPCGGGISTLKSRENFFRGRMSGMILLVSS